MKNYLILVSLFLLSLIIGAGTTYLILTTQSKKHIPSSESSSVQKTVPKFTVENPPTDSLVATIASYSGEVLWQSRVATEAAKIEKAIPFHQGESLETSKDGHITFTISSCQIHMNPKSKLNIIQTLPSNLVFEQIAGEISYTDSCLNPLAVRSGSLLIQKKSGSMQVIVDSDNQEIHLENTLGMATVGFNSVDRKTTIVSVPEQTTYLFDTEKKEGTLKKLTSKTH